VAIIFCFLILNILYDCNETNDWAFMIPWLENASDFPSSEYALTAKDNNGSNLDGLLCASRNINAELLARSYPRGIYPWYNAGEPVLWWTPSQRAVLFCNEFKLHKSLRKTLRYYQSIQNKCANSIDIMQVRIDTNCAAVMQACANRPNGTWMTTELQAAYLDWHHHGVVHSVETWLNGVLVGGFYGVGIGRMFYGESMFSHIDNASKIALACFVQWFTAQGGDVLDCQQDTAHLLSLGARTLPRIEFEALIAPRCAATPINWHAAQSLDLLHEWREN
jgi:leucyl/phenylalanyl-tRNA---protein transferase